MGNKVKHQNMERASGARPSDLVTFVSVDDNVTCQWPLLAGGLGVPAMIVEP